MIKKERIVEVMQKDGGRMTVRDIAAMVGEEEGPVDKVVFEMRAEGFFGPLTFNERSQREYILASKLPSLNGDEPATPAVHDDRPAFKDLDYNGVHDRILESIDASACTLNQLKRHAGFAPGDDISDVLDSMMFDKEIERADNGTITAFFRKGIVPERFWPDGDVIGAEWGTIVRPASAAPTPTPTPTSDATVTLEIHDEAEPAAPLTDKIYGRGKTTFTLAKVEATAATEGTFSGTARALGYHGENAFRVMCNKYPEVMAAFERGKAKHKDADPILRRAKTEPIVAEKLPKASVRPIDEPALSEAAAIIEPGIDGRQSDMEPVKFVPCPACPRCGHDSGFNYDHLSNSVNIDCYDRDENCGMESPLFDTEQEAIDWWSKPFVHQARPVEVGSRFDGRISIEHFRPLLPEDLPADVDPQGALTRGAKSDLPPVNSIAHTFHDGGKILLAFEGDYFTATPPERTFLKDLADLFDRWTANDGYLHSGRRPGLWQRTKEAFGR